MEKLVKVMGNAKEQLYYLKAKILKLQDVPDNIRLELANDIYKIEQALNIDDVSKAKAELLGKFYVHLSEQAIIHDTCRNDEEMEEAIRKFNL